MDRKIIMRLFLVVSAMLMSGVIILGVVSCCDNSREVTVATPDEPPATMESAPVETSVQEPTTLPLSAESRVEHLMCPDIQYKSFNSLEETKSFGESVGKAIDMITTEYELGNYSEGELELIRKEKVRLEEIQEKVLYDIDKMSTVESPTEKGTKPSSNSNKKPSSNQSSTQSSKPSTQDEPKGGSGKYKHATKVWNYLKSKGYSDVVCAGIMGNFMTETGGHTLALNPTAYGGNGKYYGIAQWSVKYYPKVAGKDLDYQLDYLSKTIKREFDACGHLYKKGFTYEDFLKMDSPRDAALAFAKVYERCGSGSYNKRQNGAEIAYDYFT